MGGSAGLLGDETREQLVCLSVASVGCSRQLTSQNGPRFLSRTARRAQHPGTGPWRHRTAAYRTEEPNWRIAKSELVPCHCFPSCSFHHTTPKAAYRVCAYGNVLAVDRSMICYFKDAPTSGLKNLSESVGGAVKRPLSGTAIHFLNKKVRKVLRFFKIVSCLGAGIGSLMSL